MNNTTPEDFAICVQNIKVPRGAKNIRTYLQEIIEDKYQEMEDKEKDSSKGESEGSENIENS